MTSYDKVCQLGIETATDNDSGDVIVSMTFDDPIFCAEQSIGYREHYKAAAVNLRPEVTLKMPYDAWDGQTVVKYNDVIYHIERNYKKGEEIELVLEKRVENGDTQPG